MPYLLCDRCRLSLPESVFNTPDPVACPSCHAPLLVRTFPAFYRPRAEVRAPEKVASEEDASCFYHPGKKAVVPCGQCGRFLCALCDLELDGRHLCPGCVEGAHTAGGQAALQVGLLPPQRTLHDRIALSLSILPLLLWPLTLLTSPVALYMAIRYWNEPRQSPIPRRRWRLVLAALLSLAQLAGWIYLLYYRVFRFQTFVR